MQILSLVAHNYIVVIFVMQFLKYERQVSEHQEKKTRLQRRLTQAEQRAASASQQVREQVIHPPDHSKCIEVVLILFCFS